MVLAVFDGPLLFVALHSNVIVLSVFCAIMIIEVVFCPALLVMSVDPRYQVMFGAGSAFLLTTHRTSLSEPSLIVKGLSLGMKETL